MKRAMAVLLSAAMVAASPGRSVPSAFSQAFDVPAPQAGLGSNGAPGVGAFGIKPFSGSPGEPLSFNNPGFLVLESISAQLERVAPALSASGRSLSPDSTVRALGRLLSSPQATANPSSPEAVSARTIFRALQSPEKIPALAVGLSGVHPAIGAAVAARLRDAAARFYAGGGTAPMLQRLEARAARLDAAGGVETQLELDRLFLGPFRDGAPRTSPSAGTAVFAGAASDGGKARAAAALRPARRAPSLSVTYAALVEALSGAEEIPASAFGASDAAGAAEFLRALSIHSARVAFLTSQLAELNADLRIPEAATFVIARDRQPELLRLLKIDEGRPGAKIRVSDPAGSLTLLIVAVPSAEQSQAELAAAILHAGVSASDVEGGRRPVDRLLSTGYAHKRALQRLVPAQGALGLGALPRDYDAAGAALADYVIAAVGEEPLKRLVSDGDDSVLKESLGVRWAFLRALADAATSSPRARRRKEALDDAVRRALFAESYALRDLEAALASLVPGQAEVHAAAMAQARAAAKEEEAAAQRAASRWARAFRPSFRRAPAAEGDWARAATTVVAFTSIYNGLFLAAAWQAGGVVSAYLFPSSLTLGGAAFSLFIELPVVAAGEEAVFRGGVNAWIERKLLSLGMSPQASALYAAALGSAAFAAGHIPTQGADPVNLLVKWVFGMAASHLHKSYGFTTAVASHYAWDASVTLAAVFPPLVPFLVLLPAAAAGTSLFRPASPAALPR
ncbi:MAG: CPBP family intramembrane metalloprotease [Elusimicrobia bacterium]|nr:CPBP family intramembrane metalloprotease [Elusimicrobiota bacterium]